MYVKCGNPMEEEVKVAVLEARLENFETLVSRLDSAIEKIAEAGAVPHVLALCSASAVEVQSEAADVAKVLARSAACARILRAHNGVATLEVHHLSPMSSHCRVSPAGCGT